MSNTAWLIVALVAVVVAVGGYSAALVVRERKLAQRLREPEERGH